MQTTIITPPREKKRPEFTATGKRKTSIARVRMRSGEGKIFVNDKPAEAYFGRQTLQMIIRQPFDVGQLILLADREAGIVFVPIDVIRLHPVKSLVPDHIKP